MELELTSAPSDFILYQERCFGYSIEEVAAKYEVLPEAVQEAVERYCQARGITTSRSTAERKSIALARIDLATKALMPRLVNGELAAIHAYLKLQEREAKLTGMDTDRGPIGTLKIEIPWLSQDRLSYKRQGEVVENVTDLVPLLDVKKAMESMPRDNSPES